MKNSLTPFGWILITIIVLVILAFTVAANAAPAPKYFVCKYVGTPGVDEVLQTGQNPISVSGNALTPPIVIGGYFNDAQGRSYVVAEDTGQDEPECPVPVNDPPVDDPVDDPVDEPEVPEVSDEERAEKVAEFEAEGVK